MNVKRLILTICLPEGYSKYSPDLVYFRDTALVRAKALRGLIPAYTEIYRSSRTII